MLNLEHSLGFRPLAGFKECGTQEVLVDGYDIQVSVPLRGLRSVEHGLIPWTAYLPKNWSFRPLAGFKECGTEDVRVYAGKWVEFPSPCGV